MRKYANIGEKSLVFIKQSMIVSLLHCGNEGAYAPDKRKRVFFRSHFENHCEKTKRNKVDGRKSQKKTEKMVAGKWEMRTLIQTNESGP